MTKRKYASRRVNSDPYGLSKVTKAVADVTVTAIGVSALTATGVAALNALKK